MTCVSFVQVEYILHADIEGLYHLYFYHETRSSLSSHCVALHVQYQPMVPYTYCNNYELF